MILKDARNIFIENEDVQRIRIFNEIVWEKNRPTKLLLTTSTTSTSFLNSYTLTATLSEDTQQQTPVNGTIKFYEKNDNSNDTLVGTANTSIENNISTATLTLTNKDIKTHEYYAVFEKTDKYKQSQSTNINVTIKKDTPQFTMLGTTNIYNTWNIGVKLTNSKNNALNKCTVEYGSVSTTTNSAGKAIFSISGKTEGSTLSVTYKFNGNDYYNQCSLTKKYTIQKPASKVSNITELDRVHSTSTDEKTKPYQYWYTISKNGISKCGQKDNDKTAIASSAGTYKRPDTLKATFTKINGKVFDAKFSYADSILPGHPARNGGYAKIGAPTITISHINYEDKTQIANSGPKQGVPKAGPPDDSSYKTHLILWQNESGLTMSEAPTVTINYPANTGGELGVLYLKSLKLSITYIPTQTAL